MFEFTNNIYKSLNSERIPCTVYVICCNDSVEYAIINNGSVEHAIINDKNLVREEMAKLRAAHFEKNKELFNDEKNYNIQYYWHIRKINGAYVGR
jgi:hypothetical protein